MSTLTQQQLDDVNTYLQSQQWILARKLLLDLHLRYKTDTKILYKLGHVNEKLNHFELASQCYQRCINYDNFYHKPRNPKYYLKLALLYVRFLNNDNEAQQIFRSINHVNIIKKLVTIL